MLLRELRNIGRFGRVHLPNGRPAAGHSSSHLSQQLVVIDHPQIGFGPIRVHVVHLLLREEAGRDENLSEADIECGGDCTDVLDGRLGASVDPSTDQ